MTRFGYAIIVFASLCFFCGLWLGWHIQGLRIQSITTEYKNFVSSAKNEAAKAQFLADQRAKIDAIRKTSSDKNYEKTITILHSNIERMRLTRSSTDILPTATATSGGAETICFRRPQLERAIRQLDEGISDIVAKGDDGFAALDSVKKWAQAAPQPQEDSNTYARTPRLPNPNTQSDSSVGSHSSAD